MRSINYLKSRRQIVLGVGETPEGFAYLKFVPHGEWDLGQRWLEDGLNLRPAPTCVHDSPTALSDSPAKNGHY